MPPKFDHFGQRNRWEVQNNQVACTLQTANVIDLSAAVRLLFYRYILTLTRYLLVLAHWPPEGRGWQLIFIMLIHCTECTEDGTSHWFVNEA